MPNVIFQRFESFLSFNRYRYLWVALALMVVAIGCYVFAPVKTEHNGGTWFGYTLGVISVGLMVWLAALGLRKRLIRPGKWSQKGRTSAHVYLGIALALVATLHTGFQFGWNVHTAAFGGMMIVIVSGFIGVAIYVTVPSKLSENAGSQTFVELKSQLDQVNLQLDKVLFELDGPWYQPRDTALSLGLLVLSALIDVLPKALAVVVFYQLYELSPLKTVVGTHWWAWCLLFVLDDLIYYWFHRANHEVRLFWAGHEAHHSAQIMNFGTALRQGVGERIHKYWFWLPLPLLGFHPVMVLTMWELLV